MLLRLYSISRCKPAVWGTICKPKGNHQVHTVISLYAACSRGSKKQPPFFFSSLPRPPDPGNLRLSLTFDYRNPSLGHCRHSLCVCVGGGVQLRNRISVLTLLFYFMACKLAVQEKEATKYDSKLIQVPVWVCAALDYPRIQRDQEQPLFLFTVLPKNRIFTWPLCVIDLLIHAHICTHIPTYTCMYVMTHMHAYIHTQTHAYTHKRMHTYTYAHIPAHI